METCSGSGEPRPGGAPTCGDERTETFREIGEIDGKDNMAALQRDMWKWMEKDNMAAFQRDTWKWLEKENSIASNDVERFLNIRELSCSFTPSLSVTRQVFETCFKHSVY